MISKVGLIAGMGDALNARSFLVEYCRQKNIPRNKIAIYTENYWWMFEGMGFVRGAKKYDFRGLIGFKNFGNYNMPKVFQTDKCDLCIAKNAGIDYSFDVRTPLPMYEPIDISLPSEYVTINTGYGRFSGKATNPAYVSTKSWPISYWEQLTSLLSIPVIQIGAGPSCKPVKNVFMNLLDKTNIYQTATILRGGKVSHRHGRWSAYPYAALRWKIRGVIRPYSHRKPRPKLQFKFTGRNLHAMLRMGHS